MKAIRLIALLACMVATLDTVAQEQEIRVFAHRGGRMEHDENTLSAFQASKRGNKVLFLVAGRTNFRSFL